MSLEDRRRAHFAKEEKARLRQQEIEVKAVAIRQEVSQRILNHPVYLELMSVLSNRELLDFLQQLWAFWDPKEVVWEDEQAEEMVEINTWLGKKKTKRMVTHKVEKEYPASFSPVIHMPLSPQIYAEGISTKRLQRDFGTELDQVDPEKLDLLVKHYFDRSRNYWKNSQNQAYSGGKSSQYLGPKDKALQESLDWESFGIQSSYSKDRPGIFLGTPVFITTHPKHPWVNEFRRELFIPIEYSSDGVSFNIEEIKEKIVEGTSGENFIKCVERDIDP